MTTQQPKQPLLCSICEYPIVANANGWAGGNSADPVNDGRCCDRCDVMVVIPARIAQLYKAAKPSD